MKASKPAKIRVEKKGWSPALLEVMKPISPEIDPANYLHASGEVFFLLLAGSWIITAIFAPEVVGDNTINDRLGYNNLCVGFDDPPAVYYAAPLFVLMCFLGIRFAALDTTRAYLQRANDEITETAFKFTVVSNSAGALSVLLMPMLFVVTPYSSPWGHLLLFLQYVVSFYLTVAANFYEAETLLFKEKAFLIFFGVASFGLIICTILAYLHYDSDFVETSELTEFETDDFVVGVPPAVSTFFDYAWFFCLPLISNMLPPSPTIRVQYSLHHTEEERQRHDTFLKQQPSQVVVDAKDNQVVPGSVAMSVL